MLRSIAIALSLAVAAPTVALAQAVHVICKDGSHGKAGRAACAHHGGIASPASEAPASEAPASETPAPAPPTSPPPLTAPSTRAPATPSKKAP